MGAAPPAPPGRHPPQHQIYLRGRKVDGGENMAPPPPARLHPHLPHPPGPFPFSCRLLPSPFSLSPHRCSLPPSLRPPRLPPLSPRWGREEEAQRTHLSFSSPQLFTTQGSSSPQGAAILALPPPPIQRPILPSNPSAAQTSPTLPPHCRPSLTPPRSSLLPRGPFSPVGDEAWE